MEKTMNTYSELSNCADYLNCQLDNFNMFYCEDFESKQEQLNYCNTAKYKLMALKGISAKLLDMIKDLENQLSEEIKQTA